MILFSNRIISRPAFTGLVLFLASLLVLSCARPRKPAQPEVQAPNKVQTRIKATEIIRPEQPARPRPPAQPRPTAREFVAQKLREQHSAPASIYAPPEPGFGNGFFIELYKGTSKTLLATDVTAFQGGMDGLALGLDGGEIRLYSDWSCPALVLPPKSRIGLMAWQPASPILAVTEDGEALVRVFELVGCSEIANHVLPSLPSHLAVSSNGAWLALVDEVHDLWIGKVLERPMKAARLRFAVLDMAFSPAGGLVLVVDQSGWLTSWSSSSGERVRTVMIPGGPFVLAEIQGGRVFLTDFNGKVLAWSILEEKFIEAAPAKSPFSLEDGLLTHTVFKEDYLKRLHIGRPGLEAVYSPSGGVLRISDINGKKRFYSAASGLETEAVNAEDWLPLVTGPEATVNIAGQTLLLADTICRQGKWHLLARHTGNDTFYVWWVEAEDLGRDIPRPGELPVRFGLKPDQVEWRRIFEMNSNTIPPQE